MKKRFMAMLLTVAMVLGMMATPASAASSLQEAMSEVNIYARNTDLVWLTMNGSVKTQWYTYYNFTSASGETKEIPAYCVDPRLYGVPAKVPEGTAIKYSATETITDPKVMGIISNGYPHMTFADLGVNSIEEAYYATKTALWCYLLGNWNVSGLGINPALTGADKEAAQRVLQATKAIYQRGMRWTSIPTPKLSATPDTSTAVAATIKGADCYAQTFTVTTGTWSLEPVLISLAEGAPSGAKITDMDGDEISSLNVNDAEYGSDGYSWKVKVVYPKSSIEGESGTAKIVLRSTVVQYELYFAKTLEADKYGNIQEYVLDTDPRISPTASAISSYSNEPDTPDTPDNPGDPTPEASTLKIIKLEEGTEKPLAGAIFRVLYPNGEEYGSFSTDNSGTITLPVKVFGNYTVTELVPPQYHTLPTHTTQHVTVTATTGGVLTFRNAPFGSLRVHKISDSGDNLEGVSITVKNLSTGETQTGKTGAGGVAEFTELAPGGYEVRETAGIKGYVLDVEATQTATVVTGETSEVTFINKEKPGLRIIKYDRSTLKVMSDVTFEIWKDGKSIGQYTTDQMGEIVMPDLEPGTYLVKEVQAPDSHVTDTTPQQIELKAGDGIRELVFFNSEKPKLRLIKVDSENLSKVIPNAKFSIKKVEGNAVAQEYTTDINGEIDLSKLEHGSYVVTELDCPGYVIDDAQRVIELRPDETGEFVFTNSKRPTIHIIKLSSDGTPLPGVSFRIAKIEDGASYLDRTTDANGEILIDNLDPGVYSVREVATTSRHILDLREFHVELFPGKTSTLVVENHVRPNLYVYKYDSDTGEPIPDTVFTVRAADGHSVDEIKTDSTGKATLTDLLPGVYEISEKSVPADWLMDAPAQLVTLYADRDHTAYFFNHRKPTLTVNKVSSVTGKALEGAKFNVTYGSNSTTTGEINDLGTYYTDENGQFTLTRLTDGWYKVTELASVDGYQPANVKNNVQTLYIGGGDNAVMTFENVPLSAITVYKYDNVTGEAISGAVFEVRYLTDTSGTGGTAIGRYKTSANGSFTVTGLVKGTYIVEELASDSAHVIDTAPQTAFLSGEDQDVVQLYFGNVPKGSVLIRKIDSITHAPLSGVQFFITDSTGAALGNANGYFTTDSSGSILLDSLSPSVSVIVKETRTISGYILDDTPQTVKVKPGETVSLEFLNQPKGNLIIRKFDSVTKQPLPGAEFKVTAANGELTPDNEGLTSSNGLYLTDENGQITLSKLTPATYVISETKAPDGYALDKQAQTVVVGTADTQTVSFYNEPLATLMLLKRDAVSKLPLANAEFTVKTADGMALGTNNGTFTTDDTGTATVTGIQPNTAVVVSEDSAPAGYVANSTPKTIVVKSGVPNRLTFDNEPTTTLLIHKYIEGTNNEPLSGVGFRVTDSTGAAVGPNNGTYYTDRAGEIMLTGLAPGITVTAQEFKTVDGYVLDGTPQSVLIKDYQKMELTFWNARQGSLTIRKLDSITKAPLAGAEFQLAYANGSYVDNANGHLSSNGIYTTNSNGEIHVSGVTGTIVATEVKAPDGYVIGTDKSQTVVVNTDDTQTLTFYNDPLQNIVIEKFIDGTNKPLSGVTFFVTDGAGNPIGKGEYVTDANGRITLTGLVPGTTVIARETKTVKGYTLNGAAQTIVVGTGSITSTATPSTTGAATASGTGNTLTFYDAPLSVLIIQKYAEGTTAPIKGARFVVTDGRGSAVGTTDGEYATDEHGQIILRDLEPGTVIHAKEVKAADGYILDGSEKHITIQSGDVQTLTFYNSPTGTLILTKRDRANDKPLAGAKFRIEDSTGAAVGNDGGKQTSNGEYITGEDGTIKITGLNPGTLVIREVKAPDGYTLNTQPLTVEIKAGDAQTVNFYDDAMQTLTLHKYETGTTNPLPGVTFKIIDSTGAALGNSNGEFVTDRSGQIVLTGLTPGVTVTAQEIKTISGYVLDSKPQSILIKSGEAQELVFYNAKKGSLIIEKRDSESGKLLPGAEFRITTIDGEYVDDNEGAVSTQGLYKTGSDGRITLTKLQPNTYVISEVKAPEGYVLDEESRSVKVNAADTQTIVFQNTPKQNLVIEKFIDGTNKPLSGVTFFVTDGAGNPIGKGEYVTDANGRITLTGLVPGTTVIARETKAVKGYTLNGAAQTIVVGTGSITSTATPSTTGAATASGTDNALTFYDSPLSVLVIQKYAEGTTTPIKGARFVVTDGRGAAVGTTDGEYATDEHGQIILRDLEPGTVIHAKEIKAADGYVLDGSEKHITIQSGDVQTLTFYNSTTGTLILTKRDRASDKPLAGAKFQIEDSTGAAVGNDGGKQTSNGEYTTGEDGTIKITGLNPGTLVIREVKAPDGYTLNTQPLTVEIKAGDTQTVNFYDDATQALTLQKYITGTTTPISGVTFLVTASDGSVIGPNNGEFVTDRNGRVTITGLTPGMTVTARETKQADGYVLDGMPQSIEIKSGAAQTMTFYNTPVGGLIITKSDEETGARISGVKFEVRKLNGEIIGQYTTDRNGVIRLPELEKGWYSVTEQKAASGYQLDTTPQQIEVKDGQTATLDLTNRKTSRILLHKIDADTGKGIYGVTFLLYDANHNPIGEYQTDQDGYIYMDEGLADGRYYVRELKAADGYIPDTELKTIYVKYGSTSEITWKNKAVRGQIQIVKKSANDNPINGLPAGTLLEGAEFEIYDKAGNVVDTIKSDSKGRAVSQLLPLSRYTVKEVKAPNYYAINPTVLNAYLEHEGQIVNFEVLDESLATGVAIKKSGYTEVMPGQPIRYTVTGVANTSTVALSSFYWRDVLPGQVTLSKVVTGTYNQQLAYKVVYKTNLSGDQYRTLADNLSTTKNYVLEARPAALGLAANERVTEIMFVFGTVKAGFAEVETAYIYGTVNNGLTNGSTIANSADVGGLYNGQWVQGASRWLTTVYTKNTVKLPKTGY